MRSLIFLLFVLTFIACNNNTEITSTETSDTLVQNSGSNDKTDASKPIPTNNENGDKVNGSCYMQVLQRDTIVLQIDSEAGDNISGKLSFDNYEKDGSTG